MIVRKALLLLQILAAFASTPNEQIEGSGDLQNLVNGGEPEDQETGSGHAEISVTLDPPTSDYDTYLDSEFEPSIEEALLSSDSWMVDNTGNDIIFVNEEEAEKEEPPAEGKITPEENTDDEDYVAEISGNSPLEAAEEETNALGGQLTLDESNTRTLDTPPKSRVIDIENDIEVIAVQTLNSTSVHIDGNALGKTGDKETAWFPVLDNFSGLSAILLLVAAVLVGALLSIVVFVLVRYIPCGKSSNVPQSKMDHFYPE